MTRTSLVRVLSFLVFFATPAVASAQATCVDGTGDMCLNVLRTARADGVVDDIFQTRDGLYAPQLSFAHLIRGVNGCIGATGIVACPGVPIVPADPRFCRHFYEGYACGSPGSGPPGGDDPAFQANSLDWYWTQIVRTHDDGSGVADGEEGFYYPWRGRIMDIGGEANRVVLFPITDHPPLPCEAFEYTVWLSNNPDATTIAPEDAPDPMQWNPARLIRAFTQGWTRNVLAEGAVDGARTDLGTFLRDTNGDQDAIADALATVWSLPCGLSFRYVAIQGGNNGNPGPECAFHSQEDELDAVAGLNEDDTAICLDMDGDGHRAATCGGDDCDDADPAVHPGAFEPCDATRDLDCMPPVACPSGTMCDASSGLCATACFEGACAAGYTCTADGLCTESACAALPEPCPSGTICRAGACVDPCDGVVCPGRLACIGGACIDLCLGVICPSMQICVADRPGAVTLCGPACTCTDIATTSLCPAGTACDARPGSGTTGLCVDPGCETLTCGPGEVCADGACVDGCAGVTCPLGQTCHLAECVVDRCASVTCGGGQVCREGACFDACDGVSCATGMRCRNGACEDDPCAAVDCGEGNRCVEGSCVPDGPVDAGSTGFDAGVRPDSGRGDGRVTMPGCACRVGASSAGASASLALLGLIVLALVVRRRR
jgi:MYXO-CTERM domain-containing protein